MEKCILLKRKLVISLKIKQNEKPTYLYKYPWLDDKDERKCMTDREILDKYIHLDNSCLTKAEMKEVRELLYKYKDALSLRDEIETCPNIEVEKAVTDKTPFSKRPFHAKEEDKTCWTKK